MEAQVASKSVILELKRWISLSSNVWLDSLHLSLIFIPTTAIRNKAAKSFRLDVMPDLAFQCVFNCSHNVCGTNSSLIRLALGCSKASTEGISLNVNSFRITVPKGSTAALVRLRNRIHKCESKWHRLEFSGDGCRCNGMTRLDKRSSSGPEHRN